MSTDSPDKGTDPTTPATEAPEVPEAPAPAADETPPVDAATGEADSPTGGRPAEDAGNAAKQGKQAEAREHGHDEPRRDKESSKPQPKEGGPGTQDGPREGRESGQDQQDRQRSRRGSQSRSRRRKGRQEQGSPEAGRDGEGGNQEGPGKPQDGESQAGEGGGKRKRPPRKKKPEVLEGPPVPVEGLVEISPKGFGFVRMFDKNFAQDPVDPFITPDNVRNWNLRHGHMVTGSALKGSRGPQFADLESINGEQPDFFLDVPAFEELKAINPDKRIILETTKERYTTRVIDMMSPVGRGQRGLIVAPPRTGKTTLLQHIGEAVVENHPDTHLMVLLIDERPEEVTEFRRSLPQAEHYASSNDGGIATHTRTALFAIERARRLVEMGRDVVILLDSITRLARSFNQSMRGKGRKYGSGGLDTRALEIPRKIFASARNVRDGGSLTILATALVETGSRMDEAIFFEFKGTGNMELVLDRKIAEHYVYPAVDIFRSGTRREELILPPHWLAKIATIRRGLSGHKPIEAIERLLSFCERFPSNAEMLAGIPG